MEDVNDALLLKWAWRFKTGGNCLWKKVVIGCHGLSRNWSLLPCTASASGCWKQIVKIGKKKIWSGKTLGSYFEGIVGDGSVISFWIDSWLREEPLRLTYPHLFRLETKKWAVVADRIRVVSGSKSLLWEWRAEPSSDVEVSELFNLMEDIYDYVWKGGPDKWRWKASGSSRFTVSSARRLLSSYPRPFIDMQMNGSVGLH